MDRQIIGVSAEQCHQLDSAAWLKHYAEDYIEGREFGLFGLSHKCMGDSDCPLSKCIISIEKAEPSHINFWGFSYWQNILKYSAFRWFELMLNTLKLRS